MLENGLSSLMQSAQPSPGVFGPLPQGTATPEIIFLLVEGQQGARIGKGRPTAPWPLKGQEGTFSHACH